MMKTAAGYLLLFFLLAIPFVSFGQRCDSIPWSAHDLKWKYFKGKADKNSPSAAMSEIHIYYHFTARNKTADFRFTCSFSMCNSWVKDRVGHGLLDHEQTHFDIAEYFRRLLVKEILAQKLTHANITEKVESIGTLINKLRRETDALYDLETDHSLIENKQKEWMKKVHKLLRKENDFKKDDYRVTLN